MITRLSLLITTALIFFLIGQPVLAADITDEVTDIEELTADSAAAKGEARAATARVEKERVENARELKSVREARQVAQLKKQEASETLNRSEAELQRLAGEKTQLNKDVLKLGHETMVSERLVAEAKGKVEKLKIELAALTAMKTEKHNTLAVLNQQKMQLMRESGAADDEFATQQRQLQKADEEEQAAIVDLEQVRAEEVVRKVVQEAKIKELKEHIQTARVQRKSLDTDVKKYKSANRRLEDQTKVGMSELNQMTAPAEPKP